MPPRSSRASSHATPGPYATRSRRPTADLLPSKISRGATSHLYGTDELPPVGTGLADVNTSLAFAAELSQEVDKAERAASLARSQSASEARMQSSSQLPSSPLGNRQSTQPQTQRASQPLSRSPSFSPYNPSSQLRSEASRSASGSSPLRVELPSPSNSRQSSEDSDSDMDSETSRPTPHRFFQRKSVPSRLHALRQTPLVVDDSLPSGGIRHGQRMFDQHYEGGLEIPSSRRSVRGVPKFLQNAAIELFWAALYALPILFTIYLSVKVGPFVAKILSTPRPVSVQDSTLIPGTNQSELPPISVVPKVPHIHAIHAAPHQPKDTPKQPSQPNRPQDPPQEPPQPITSIVTTTIHRAGSREKVLTDMQNDIRGMQSQIRSMSDHVREFDGWRSSRLRPNFFSPILGAVIDPAYTSPTNPRGTNILSRLYQTLRYRVFHNPSTLPPTHALTPWTENGDCWCAAAAPRGRLSIGVRLGRDVVPRALVVDHVPKSAALDAGTAPRRLDVWGRVAPGFDVDALPNAWRDGAKGCESPSPAGKRWVCLGKMAYNIEDASHVQELSLAGYYGAPPFKIDRAVVRVLDNYGASHTCLYQIKLEGWTGNDEEHD